ncbi:hypothetical protein ABZ419_11530 [Streptomyces cinnamoneus]|uniref:hypothetical protein n=1 Tax=Streptomyces cinnamoneus TaxID=53446 RepID=UPI0033CB4E04
MLDHEEDIDADFLAWYGIDLQMQEIPGPRYFALAHRLTAFSGVMAARVEAQRERQDASQPRAAQAPRYQARGDGAREISLTAFRVMFPGIVSSAEA